MAKKLSNLKIRKIILLHQQGYNQSAIAKLMHIDQSTVSNYIAWYEALAEQKGADAASLMLGIEDKQEETQTIVEEFKDSGLTMADVDIAVQLDKKLQACGVKRGDYHDFIELVKKTKDSSYLDAAAKLSQLEDTTGLGYQAILDKAVKTEAQVEKSKKELEKLTAGIEKAAVGLKEATEKRKKASEYLEDHMKQIKMTEGRLKKVEPLVAVLNAAGVPDIDLPEYVARQKSLNKAGIDAGVFSQILEKVKIATKGDGGALLLSRLSECGSLTKSISAAKEEKQFLEKVVADLEEKKKIQAKLESENKKLAADKANLEAQIADLQKMKAELDQTPSLLYVARKARAQLTEEIGKMESEIAGKEAKTAALEKDIAAREQKVTDLGDLESKREKLLGEIGDLESRLSKEKRRWQVFEGFLGLVQANSREELEKATKTLPAMLEELDKKNYSPDYVRSQILKHLAVPGLWILRCVECGTRFYMDKPVMSKNYYCPSGNTWHKVIVDEDISPILRHALAEPKFTPGLIIKAVSPPKSQQPEQTPKEETNPKLPPTSTPQESP